MKKETLFEVLQQAFLDSDLIRLKTGGVTLDSTSWAADANGRKIVKAGTPVGKQGNGKYGPAAKASVVIGDAAAKTAIQYTAKKTGAKGNNISIEYVDPGQASQALSVTVNGTKITVSLATDGAGAITSTAADVVAAVNGDTDAAALVAAALYGDGNDGSGVLDAVAETSLSGGLDAEFLTLVEAELTDGDATVSVFDWGRVVVAGLPVTIDDGHKETLTGITWVE